jgi:hypothetical protein
MDNLNHPEGRSESGLDITIKLITILKLLIQTAFWGLTLGVTVWFLTSNPLPKIIALIQQQTIQLLK